MRIRMRSTGRVYEGSADEVVAAMQADAVAGTGMTLAEYCDWVAANGSRFRGVELDARGRTAAEKAESLLSSMVGLGLVDELDAVSSAFR
jgi:hypothetical protein